MASAIDSPKKGLASAVEQSSRCLRVSAELLAKGKEPLLLFKVDCPRRGRVGVEECVDCGESGRLLFDADSTLAAVVCKLPPNVERRRRLYLVK